MKINLDLDVHVSDDGCVAVLTHPSLLGELQLVCGTPAQLSQTLEFFQPPGKQLDLQALPNGVKEITDAIATIGQVCRTYKALPRNPIKE